MTDAQESDEFDNDTIFNTVMVEMGGSELPGKSNIFYVDELNRTVKRSQIMDILCDKFKAVKTRIIRPDGTRPRGLKISSEVLERIKASYEDAWEIAIVPIEDSSAPVNQPNQVLDQHVGQNKKDSQERNTENHEGNQHKNTSFSVENEHKEASSTVENNTPISTEPGLPGLVGQRYSIEDIIKSIMKDEQGNNIGYFTTESWKTKLKLLPIQDPLHCDVYEAEQTLQALVEEGKLQEIETGKYRPTEKLSTRDGEEEVSK